MMHRGRERPQTTGGETDMKLPIPALLTCAMLLPATAALAWSPEWEQCKDVNNKDGVARALAACTHILALDSERPNYAMALRNRCGIKYTADDYDGALEDCNRAVSMDPKSAIGYERRGHVFVMKGETKRAMADYDEAIRLDPRNAYALNARGHLKQRLGDNAGGDADIARAEKIKPDINQ
jgi:tetratricopeptide (TPR) repeat protein